MVVVELAVEVDSVGSAVVAMAVVFVVLVDAKMGVAVFGAVVVAVVSALIIMAAIVVMERVVVTDLIGGATGEIVINDGTTVDATGMVCDATVVRKVLFDLLIEEVRWRKFVAPSLVRFVKWEIGNGIVHEVGHDPRVDIGLAIHIGHQVAIELVALVADFVCVRGLVLVSLPAHT